MKRKLILMGGKTHVISLPAKFVKQYSLKKGEELEVNIDQNKIIIETGNEIKKDKEIAIKADKNLFLKLNKLYQLGYDKIYIKDIYDIEGIELALNSFPGLEIVKISSNHCILKQISEMNFKEFDNILRRILLLMQSYVKSKSKSKKQTIEKLINFCKRCINKKGYGDYNKSLSMYGFLCEIEKYNYNSEQLKKFYNATLKPQNIENIANEKTTLYECAFC